LPPNDLLRDFSESPGAQGTPLVKGPEQHANWTLRQFRCQRESRSPKPIPRAGRGNLHPVDKIARIQVLSSLPSAAGNQCVQDEGTTYSAPFGHIEKTRVGIERRFRPLAIVYGRFQRRIKPSLHVLAYTSSYFHLPFTGDICSDCKLTVHRVQWQRGVIKFCLCSTP
jgi:hypothetical protein